MSSLNKVTLKTTHYEVKTTLTSEQKLMRVVMAHMLWEDQFYMNGKTSAQLVTDLVGTSSPAAVALIAEKARNEFKLRHIPLLLVRELARRGTLKAKMVDDVVKRPDEMAELLSIYWKDGKSPISTQLKKGLATSFAKFNEFQLAKWDKNSAAISMRDVMFLCRPEPKTVEQANLFQRIANKEMKTPDTWEVALSSGADKAETFTRLMDERNLGGMAFLRNLRNMLNSGIAEDTIRAYSKEVNVDKILPFRFIVAARVVPALEDMLEEMMFRACEKMERIPGKTVVVVDVSGSMFGPKVSAKSDIDRFDAAAALSVLLRELCEDVKIFSFSGSAVAVAPRRGFALVEAIRDSQQHGGTALGRSMQDIDKVTKYDRVIVVTDEQSYDRPAVPKGKGYILNVGSYVNGIEQKEWVTITGFSEAVISYIQMLEKE